MSSNPSGTCATTFATPVGTSYGGSRIVVAEVHSGRSARVGAGGGATLADANGAADRDAVALDGAPFSAMDAGERRQASAIVVSAATPRADKARRGELVNGIEVTCRADPIV